ncbi:MAG: heparinase II/III family protein, partial [Armatimonadota bacterium]
HEGRAGTGEGGHIPQLIIGEIDRDGVGAEGSPGYSLGWSSRMAHIANLLSDYEAYTNHDMYRDFPQVKKSVLAAWRLAILGANTPNIGDAGKTGSRGIAALSADLLIEAYKRLKDPELALVAVRAKDGRYEGLGRDILAEDPDWVQKEVEELLAERGLQPEITGENLSGYGLVSCEFGPPNTGHGLWMYYGRNGGHGHRDRLNFGLDAYGVCMSPDLGYPEFATRWAKRSQWTDNTISHNTVIINEAPQSTNWVGHPQFFAQFDDFGGFCVQSPGVYPDTAETYERTMALVKVGPQQAYALDIFRVAGGSDHLMSFHGLEADVTATGLNLTKQEGGSYAGPDVEFKDSPWNGPKAGYAWLDNVERDENPAPAFMLDYAAAAGYRGVAESDDLHLRYHFLSQADDIALCDGHPPSNKPGNPDSLRYLMAHRQGEEGLQSTFAAIVEPYRAEPLISEVTRLQITGAEGGIEPVAVKIELADGRTDYLLSGPDDNTVYETEDGISFAGRLIGLRTRDGAVETVWMIRASEVRMGDFAVKPQNAGYRGIISKMDKDMEGDGCIWVDTPLPVDETLRGAEIIIENDRKRNAVYTIQSVEKDGDLYKINCGEVAFIRSFKDPMNYEAGYVYNFEEGAEWIIPNAVRLHRHGDSLIRTTTSSAVTLDVQE